MKQYKFESACKRFKLFLPEYIYCNMIHECKKSSIMETGGILIGYYSADLSCVIITHATAPPCDSKKEKTTFRRGTKDLISKLDYFWETREEYYIGEWHYHPLSSPKPSARDIMQMKKLSINSKLKCPEPILIIMGQEDETKWIMSINIFIDNTYFKFVRIN